MLACKNCGANVKYDIPSGKLSCQYCNSYFDPYEYESQTPKADSSDKFDATVFTCPQCGGQVISTDDTIAGFCSFCGASTILYNKISKQHRPDYIIPFTQTKEDCKKAYSAYMRKAIFAPKELKDPQYIDGFRGIYMPYWTFYETQKGQIYLASTKSHRQGDYIYEENYQLSGYLDAYYKGMSYDASSSFSDNISQTLVPYDVRGMKRFTPGFFSGFYADAADVSYAVYEPDAQWQAYESTTEILQKNVFSGYKFEAGSSPLSLNTETEQVDYSMFPVWFMSYRNNDRVAYATVNGQTGKVVADLPVSIKKFMLGSLIFAIPVFLLLCIFATFTPSVTIKIVGALSLISLWMYSGKLAKIALQEADSDDKGKTYINNPAQLKSMSNMDAIRRAQKLENKTNSSKPLALFVGIYIFMMFGVGIFSFVIEAVKNNSFIISAIIGIAGIVLTVSAFKQYDKSAGRKGLAGLIFNGIALGLSIFISLIDPVYDWIYYSSTILLLASTAFILTDVIMAHNILSTRKLPQFQHQGGDDNA